jgi:hypothetical protein
MSESNVSESGAGEVSRAEMQSALFAQLVLQQTNLALMLLGKTPNPHTGETMRDLDAAQLFIDQLEMLETKTPGRKPTKRSSGASRQYFFENFFLDSSPAPASARGASLLSPGTPEAFGSPPGAAVGAGASAVSTYAMRRVIRLC